MNSWEEYHELLRYECQLIEWQRQLEDAGKMVQAKNLSGEKYMIRSRRHRMKRALEAKEKAVST